MSTPSAVLDSSSTNLCDNIDNCRTLGSIVWSCAATIFACTWVVIHPNIPPQKESWVRRHGRRVITTVVAIIAPELVICWAAKQYLASWRLAQQYREFGWTQAHGFFLIMGGYVIHGDGWSEVVSMRRLRRARTAGTPSLYSTPSPAAASPIAMRRLATASQFRNQEMYEVDLSKQKLDVPAVMSAKEVLVWRNTIRFDGRPFISTCLIPHITIEEINDKSKGDGLSKGLAMLQTSWFILQCVARGSQRLPLTELELATCAFAALNGVTYGLWWEKPQSVDCPISVGKEEPDGRDEGIDSARRDLLSQVQSIIAEGWGESTGFDNPADVFWSGLLLPLSPFLRMMRGSEVKTGDKRVGTYYGGDLGDYDQSIVQLILLASSTLFGAIHCIGWSFAFPSPLARILWRTCSLVITCFPMIEFASWTAIPKQENALRTAPDIRTTGSIIGAAVMLAALLIYIVARVVLLALAVLALTSLPAGAYQTVSWTNFIPHI